MDRKIAEPVRSKSWEEFCKNHPIAEGEWYIDGYSFLKQHPIGGRGRDSDKNLLATKEDAEATLALIQLIRLHDEWVGYWKPNWDDDSPKYAIECYRNKLKPAELRHASRLLTFPTQEMLYEFLNCCPDIKELIEKAKRFI